jgi:hypothetical protein
MTEVETYELHIGFTGTKRGLTEPQRDSLLSFLAMQRDEMERSVQKAGLEFRAVLHHGDCVGADAQAHRVAYLTGWEMALHPGKDSSGESPYRAWCADNGPPDAVYESYDPLFYAERNLHIVSAGTMLIACPDGPERQRSGTWSTVRAAIRMGRPVVVIPPDGDIEMMGMEIHDELHPYQEEDE